MKGRNKFLAFLLASVMLVLSFSNVYAATSGTTTEEAGDAVASITTNGTTYYYSSLADAFSAAESGDTITLETDVELSSPISVSGSSITLDLNGNEITEAESYSYSYIMFVTGSLTIKDSTDESDGSITSGTYYGIVVSGGTVTLESGNIVNNTGTGVWVQSSGTINVEGGSITGTTRGIFELGGTVNVSGGTVSSTSGNGIRAQGGTINVSGGTVTSASGYEAICAIGYNDLIEVNVTGGTVSSDYIAIAAYDYGEDVSVTISDDADVSATGDGTYSWTYGVYLDAGTSLTVSDSATITATNESNGSAGIVYFGNGDSADPTTITINGGTISGGTYGLSGNGSASYSSVTITDGSISGDFAIYHPEMGTITISGGEIEGVYAGVQMCAGSLVVTDGTITATASTTDVEESANNAENKTGSGPIADGAAISVINRSGYGNTQDSGDVSFDSVTISGGTITSESDVDAVQVYTYSSSSTSSFSNENDEVQIDGGTFSSDVGEYLADSENEDNPYVLLYNADGTYEAMTEEEAEAEATVYVEKTEDGTEYKIYYTSLEDIVEAEDDETIVATVTDSDGATTTYTALQAAIEAAEDGDTVTLLSDVNEDITISDSQTITLDLNGNTLTGTGTGSVITVEGSLTLEDSSDEATGTITGGNATNGGGIYISSTGSLTMNGGTVTGNTATNGGGIYNEGTFTMSDSCAIYNNTASSAGDDIYSSGTITLAEAASDTTLDDCSDYELDSSEYACSDITGWYYDGAGDGDSTSRWNGHTTGEDKYSVEYEVSGNSVTGTIALKAAHAGSHTVTVNYLDIDTNESLADSITVTIIDTETYEVEQETISGYDYVSADGSLTVDATTENVELNLYYSVEIEVSAAISWDDSDDQDGKRPESVTINLLADGEIIDYVTLTEAEDWTYTFTELGKYADGEEIEYTITENYIDEYESVISGDAENGFTVTNSYTPETLDIEITKTFDESDKDGEAHDPVTITLYANGVSTGKTITLSDDNNWYGTFTDLAKYEDGVEIEYTIKESNNKDYISVVTGDADSGYTITTYTKTSSGSGSSTSSSSATDDETEDTTSKTTEITTSTSDDTSVSTTSVDGGTENSSFKWYIPAAGVGVAAILGAVIFLKRREEEEVNEQI